jgi:tRNA dimethylallyltransferase
MGLAEQLGCELLSVDSMQVYRGFDIGTAKPTIEEQERVPHHGIDLLDPEQTFSAGAFLEYARATLRRAQERGVDVLAVGGTGLYFRAMLHGLTPSAPADPDFRDALRKEEAQSPGVAHQRLTARDPEAAVRVHPNDFVRTERALEVLHTTGITQSQWVERHAWSEAPFQTEVFGIRWERELLRKRIRQRVDLMLESGWIEEVAGLLEAGVKEDMTPMLALGYRDIAAHLRGDRRRDELSEQISTSIGRFAKRQGTWFNREPSIRWMEPGADLLQRVLPSVVETLGSVNSDT